MTETIGPWNEDHLAKLQEWDPVWTASWVEVTTDPWRSGVLSPKFVELVSLAINVGCTNLNADGTRRHIRGALAAGASRDEILVVIKMASLLAIHSCSLGAPIVLEEAKAANIALDPAAPAPTPAADKMKAIGQWNTAFDPFFTLDPGWTDAFMGCGGGIYGSKAFSPKEIELLSIAFDASFTHMYPPGTRRHIKNALAAGATPREIMEVLKLCVCQGALASNLGVAILAEEFERTAGEDASRANL
jgi:alkylhydroperoxidase/carboxymuconolactone decarboxylase family protein YurZ